MCLWCLRSAYSWDPRLHSTQKGNVVIEKVCIFFVEPGKLSFFDQKKNTNRLWLAPASRVSCYSLLHRCKKPLHATCKGLTLTPESSCTWATHLLAILSSMLSSSGTLKVAFHTIHPHSKQNKTVWKQAKVNFFPAQWNFKPNLTPQVPFNPKHKHWKSTASLIQLIKIFCF